MKNPAERGFPSAPERTRTSTDHSVHKALNLDRPLSMLLVASKSTKLRVSVDALDGLDVVDVVTGVVTADGSRLRRGARFRTSRGRLEHGEKTRAAIEAGPLIAVAPRAKQRVAQGEESWPCLVREACLRHGLLRRWMPRRRPTA